MVRGGVTMDPTRASRVFISYRRQETAYPAGWLYDRLDDRFGDASQGSFRLPPSPSSARSWIALVLGGQFRTTNVARYVISEPAASRTVAVIT